MCGLCRCQLFSGVLIGRFQCKADLVPTVTALNDASLVTSGIYSGVLNDDAEHMIVAKLLKETCKGMFIDMELNCACMGISEHSWYLVIL